ncbi:MAG: helix-turn-helix domain-containing protein, partial [Desulfobacterales bacterium]
LVMFILSYLPPFPTWFQALFDASLLVFLLSPVLYFGLFRRLVRFIAATNFDLDRMMAKNPFRNDLCYRLKGGWLHLPPLREREDTVKPLDQIQKRHILSVYEQMGHNKSRTARSLGIDLNTLRRKLESYGVD